MRVGYIQNSPVFGEKEKNFRQAETLMGGIKADVLVLPELFATGYAFTSKEEAAGLAESAEGPTAEFLKEMAVRTGAVIAAGFAERDGSAVYNSSMLVDSRGLIGAYRKIHLFNRETLWFSPGDRPFAVYDIPGGRAGLMICFDWYFPESARTLAVMGADIILHPSNLVMPYCQAAMKIRCLENRVFAVTANRVGREARGEDDFTFTGMSQVTGVKGEVMSSGPVDSVFADVIEIDIALARDKLINPYNDIIRGRRPEFYK